MCGDNILQAAFAMRVKLYSTWQSAQNTLAKKREVEQKLQAGGKPEKMQQVQQEIQEVTFMIVTIPRPMERDMWSDLSPNQKELYD